MTMSNYQSPWLNDELVMLQDASRRFFEKEFAPHTERWIEQGHVDRSAWKDAGAAGLLCAEMPAQYGGGGGDYRHDTVIMEEHLRLGIQGWGNQVHSSIVAPYIKHYGTEEQKQRWLPKMASGETGRRHRHDRTEHGFRSAGGTYQRRARRRRLRDQWRQDLHYQRPAV